MFFPAVVKINVSELSYITCKQTTQCKVTLVKQLAGRCISYKLGEFTDDPKYVLNVWRIFAMERRFHPGREIDMLPLSIALSYDVNISPLETVSQGRGGIELSISYIGFLNRG